MEVATGVAHPPGGLHHNNKIPPDYTRVEVHTVKPEFMQWRIDYATPEGLVLLRDVMVHPLAQTGHYIDCFFAASPSLKFGASC